MSARMRAARDTTDVDKEKEGREMEACEAEKGPAAAAAAAASPAPTPTPTQDTAPHPGTPTAAQPREEQLSAGYSLPRNSSVISTGSAGDLLHVAPAQEALPRQGSLRGFQRKLSSGRLKESGIDLTQQVTGMTTSASCASFTSTHVLGDVAIKKTEIRKLRDCLGIDEATALRKLQDSVEARRDRNSLADMAVLKETNVHLRKKVEDLKSELLSKDQHTAKLLDMLKLRSFEVKEANSTVKKMKADMRGFERVKAQVLLLQRQLKDTMRQLEDERSLTTRTVENSMFSAAKRGQAVGAPILPLQITTGLAAGVAGLAAAAVHLTLATDEPSPSSTALPHVPSMVAAALCITTLSAATTKQLLPQTTSKGANTDAAITRFEYTPAIEDIPRGQELLKTVYHLQAELSQLRKEGGTPSYQDVRSKRLIEKLTKYVEEKDRLIGEQRAKSEETCEGLRSQLNTFQSHVASLQTLYQGACHEMMKLRKQAGQEASSRSRPVAIPAGVKLGRPNSNEPAAADVADSTPQATETIFNPRSVPESNPRSIPESPSRCSAGSDEEPYIEGHSAPASDSGVGVNIPISAPTLESS